MKTIQINNMSELQNFINKYFDELDNSHLEAIIFNLIGVKSFFLFSPTKEVFLKTVDDLLECKNNETEIPLFLVEEDLRKKANRKNGEKWQ
jgi:site-specific recombinase XerD